MCDYLVHMVVHVCQFVQVTCAHLLMNTALGIFDLFLVFRESC